MFAVVDPYRPSPVLTTEQVERAGWMYQGALAAGAPLDKRTAALIAVIHRNPHAARAEWLGPGSAGAGSGAETEVPSAVMGLVVAIVAVVSLRATKDERKWVLSKVGATFGLPRAVGADLAPSVERAVDVVLRGEPGHESDSRISGGVRAALERGEKWMPSGRIPAEVVTALGVGMLLAGPGVDEHAVRPPAQGQILPVASLDTIGENRGASAGPGKPGTQMMVGRAPGWFAGQRRGTFIFDDRAGGLEATVTVVPSADGGHALLQHLGVEIAGPLGRPHVESLPHELGDGVVVHRAVEGRGGALATRVDLVRSVEGLDVVISSVLSNPAIVDAMVAELVVLLASIGPSLVGRPHR